MKVIILVPQLPLYLENIKGGAHSAVINLLHGFSEHDIQVAVISYTKEIKSSIKTSFRKNIEIIYENEGPFKYHSLNYLFFGNRILRKYLRTYKPDIIHYQAGNSFLFTRIPGIINYKPVLTIHGMASEEAKRKIKYSDRLKWYFNDSVQKFLHPKNIIHLSKYSLNRTLEKNNSQHAIIPNALESSYFNIPLKNKTDNILLYIGVIDNNKNILNLLKSIKALKEINKEYTLEVLGDFNNEDYKDHILSYIKFNGLSENIKFNGWVNSSEVRNFLSKSDILVVSSFHESLPMVIAESMASGKIVVASSVGGIPEMINDNEDGFLYNLNSSGELNEILDILYDNDEIVQLMSKKARLSAINKFKAYNVAKDTIEFYNRCIS